jgi:hypothetical protein
MRAQPHHAAAMVAALDRAYNLQGLVNPAAAGPAVAGAVPHTDIQEKRIVSQAVSILLMARRNTSGIEIANRALLTDPTDVADDPDITPMEYGDFLTQFSDVLRQAVIYERDDHVHTEREPTP